MAVQFVILLLGYVQCLGDRIQMNGAKRTSLVPSQTNQFSDYNYRVSSVQALVFLSWLLNVPESCKVYLRDKSTH